MYYYGPMFMRIMINLTSVSSCGPQAPRTSLAFLKRLNLNEHSFQGDCYMGQNAFACWNSTLKLILFGRFCHLCWRELSRCSKCAIMQSSGPMESQNPDIERDLLFVFIVLLSCFPTLERIVRYTGGDPEVRWLVAGSPVCWATPLGPWQGWRSSSRFTTVVGSGHDLHS